MRGIGTVVNRTVLSLRSRLDQKLEYYPLIRSFGSYPHADGIQVFPIRAGEELARDLEIEPGDDVICIKSAFWPDTTPVIYSIDYLPRALSRQPETTPPHRPDRRRVRYSGTGSATSQSCFVSSVPTFMGFPSENVSSASKGAKRCRHHPCGVLLCRHRGYAPPQRRAHRCVLPATPASR